MNVDLSREQKTLPHDQLERIVALLTLGAVVALERGAMNMDEAHQLLFTPYLMSLLRAAAVRESVVGLVHTGTELEDVSSAHELAAQYQALMNDALASLSSSAPVDFEAPKWVDALFGSTLIAAVRAAIRSDSERWELEETTRELAEEAGSVGQQGDGDGEPDLY